MRARGTRAPRDTGARGPGAPPRPRAAPGRARAAEAPCRGGAGAPTRRSRLEWPGTRPRWRRPRWRPSPSWGGGWWARRSRPGPWTRSAGPRSRCGTRSCRWGCRRWPRWSRRRRWGSSTRSSRARTWRWGRWRWGAGRARARPAAGARAAPAAWRWSWSTRAPARRPPTPPPTTLPTIASHRTHAHAQSGWHDRFRISNSNPSLAPAAPDMSPVSVLSLRAPEMSHRSLRGHVENETLCGAHRSWPKIIHGAHTHKVPFDWYTTHKMELSDTQRYCWPYSASCLCATDWKRPLHPPSADENDCGELRRRTLYTRAGISVCVVRDRVCVYFFLLYGTKELMIKSHWCRLIQTLYVFLLY